jgi:4-diphosphocytidyl-2-C-methyl-D-erythritol kinase
MTSRLTAEAFAKVNLGLVVGGLGPDGFHPLISLAQSISWSDGLTLVGHEDDAFHVDGMEASDDNLAWRAVEAVRSEAGSSQPVAVRLAKRIAVAAGLGGGSADAAAALGLAARHYGVPADRLPALGLDLGADVPFCLSGGLAILEGRGEQVSPHPMVGGYALGIVVPDFELSTPEVYRRWDEIGEPEGAVFPSRALPPGLRQFDPLRNDLQPAAEALAPELADWRSELAIRWGRPVAMSGSGPALFGFFLDEDEARDAIDDCPPGARATQATVPVPQGWREVPGTMAGPE